MNNNNIKERKQTRKEETRAEKKNKTRTGVREWGERK